MRAIKRVEYLVESNSRSTRGFRGRDVGEEGRGASTVESERYLCIIVSMRTDIMESWIITSHSLPLTAALAL